MNLYAAAALVLSLAVAPVANAALRSPQVPVLGGILQSYFNSVGENIAVNTDQQNLQHFQATTSSNTTFTFQVELGGAVSPGTTIGIYNSSAVTPTLYEVFPAGSGPGWFAVVSFRSAPVRAVVNVFDESFALFGTHVYLDADKTAFSFYLSSPDGVVYMEDARNPGGAAQFLAYAGTAINSGSWWLAAEKTPVAGGGSDQDYFDAVLFNETSGCGCTPTVKSTWGALKAFFR